MQCPTCNSYEVQRLQVVYEAGTSDIRTTSHTSGVGYSYGGGFGAGSARTDTIGTQKTRSAQRAAPPEKRSYRLIPFMLAVSFYIFWAYNRTDNHASYNWLYFGIVLFVLAIWWGISNIIYNSKQWPVKYERWKRKWFCNKCGEIYIH